MLGLVSLELGLLMSELQGKKIVQVPQNRFKAHYSELNSVSVTSRYFRFKRMLFRRRPGNFEYLNDKIK